MVRARRHSAYTRQVSLSINNMTHRHVHKQQYGFTSIEVIIGVVIAGVVFIYAGNAIGSFINTARDVTLKTEALYLAEDGLELVRYMRDNNWTNMSAIPADTTRYLSVSSTTVRATTTSEVIGIYRRSFTVQNVYRNSSTDDIVASTTGGSVADSDSKYVFMNVSWGSPTTTVTLTTILADIES